MSRLISLGVTACLFGAGVVALPAVASAQTGISDVDYQIAVNQAQRDLDRICEELDVRQKSYDDWQTQDDKNASSIARSMTISPR